MGIALNIASQPARRSDCLDGKRFDYEPQKGSTALVAFVLLLWD
jgi:hypothetical protein